MVRVEDRLETLFKQLNNKYKYLNNKYKYSAKIIFIVKNASNYILEGYALERIGYTVEIQEWTTDPFGQVRRAGEDADYVYVEKNRFTKQHLVGLPHDKDINAALGDRSLFNDCVAVGVMDFILNGINKNLLRKEVIVYGYDRNIVESLHEVGATVTVVNSHVQPAALDLFGKDMAITLPEYNKNINCYPIHIPVLDIGEKCINTENRDVVSDCQYLRLLGLLVQLW